MTRAEYTKNVARIVMDDPKLSESAAEELKNLLKRKTLMSEGFAILPGILCWP